MKQEYLGRERICKSFIDVNEKGKTLNLGAGEMQWLENDLFLGNPNFISSDIDEGNLGEKNKAKNKTLMNAEKITFKDGELSQILILDVLEHIKNEKGVIDEIYRTLKKNGKLIISVPGDNFLSFFNPIRYAQHERHYKVDRLKSILENKGFKIERIAAGGGIFELLNFYAHLIIKYTTGIKMNVKFLNRLRDKEYDKYNPNGNQIIIRAIKI